MKEKSNLFKIGFLHSTSRNAARDNDGCVNKNEWKNGKSLHGIVTNMFVATKRSSFLASPDIMID